MDWTPGNVSSDIEDRRDSSGGGGFGFGNGGGGGLGIIGFILLLIISLVTGHNFLGSVLSGNGGGAQSYNQPYQPSDRPGEDSAYGPATPRQHPAGEDRDVQLISFVLDDAQRTWTQIFQQMGRPYRHAKLVLYRGQTYSGCGTAQAQTGPFYCPQDEKIYIDLSFWDELKRFGGSTSEFAQAYVITHELGHHIQKLLGIEGREARLAHEEPSERNPLSVDLELQADCFSGIWGHSTEQRGIVHSNDIQGALSAAAAVGDDHLEQMSGRAVSPESWTHGSSAQREHWFRSGLDGGTLQSCETFEGALAPR
jgi:predicted metalloprotease